MDDGINVALPDLKAAVLELKTSVLEVRGSLAEFREQQTVRNADLVRRLDQLREDLKQMRDNPARGSHPEEGS